MNKCPKFLQFIRFSIKLGEYFNYTKLGDLLCTECMEYTNKRIIFSLHTKLVSIWFEKSNPIEWDFFFQIKSNVHFIISFQTNDSLLIWEKQICWWESRKLPHLSIIPQQAHIMLTTTNPQNCSSHQSSSQFLRIFLLILLWSDLIFFYFAFV